MTERKIKKREELTDAKEFVISLVDQAGEMARSEFLKPSSQLHNKGDLDIVTE